MIERNKVRVFGSITASIATCLIGAGPPSDAQRDETSALRAGLAGLREEIEALRRAMPARSAPADGGEQE